jgi:hypothetical protein
MTFQGLRQIALSVRSPMGILSLIGMFRRLYNGKQHNRERTQRERARIVDDKSLTPRSSCNIGEIIERS